MKLTPNPHSYASDGTAILRSDVWSAAVKATLEDVAMDLYSQGEHFNEWDRMLVRDTADRYRAAAKEVGK